jgi:hypothetical protein
VRVDDGKTETHRVEDVDLDTEVVEVLLKGRRRETSRFAGTDEEDL